MINISYLITVHNEDSTLHNLLLRLETCKDPSDEVVILDDFSDNPHTKIILDRAKNSVHYHKLDNNYGAHKNYGNSLCKNEWIFQIDADELPNEDLIINIKDIIQSNTDVELFFVPRINDFKGVNYEHARKWGWRLSEYEGRLIVNWPDYQGRIYKNIPSRIKWDRRLHEKIEGHLKYTFLPQNFDLALYHDKTIEKQIETNIRYNKNFTMDENMGHKIV